MSFVKVRVVSNLWPSRLGSRLPTLPTTFRSCVLPGLSMRGNKVFMSLYRLAGQEVCTFYRLLRTLAESRLLEIEHVRNNFLRARGSMEAVDRESLLARVRNGAVTVLDVRPEQEYQAGHLPDAVSLPLADLERRLAEIPQQREVVAYCRGPYCVMALDAVEMLRAHGFNATHMEEGVADWRARGLPVEAGGSQ